MRKSWMNFKLFFVVVVVLGLVQTPLKSHLTMQEFLLNICQNRRCFSQKLRDAAWIVSDSIERINLAIEDKTLEQYPEIQKWFYQLYNHRNNMTRARIGSQNLTEDFLKPFLEYIEDLSEKIEKNDAYKQFIKIVGNDYRNDSNFGTRPLPGEVMSWILSCNDLLLGIIEKLAYENCKAQKRSRQSQLKRRGKKRKIWRVKQQKNTE